MKVELKTWGTLGLATALAGAGLAGCSGEAGEGGEAGEAAAVGEAGEAAGGEAGEGEGGEGGEGEGGVAVGEASSDPVVYGSSIAIAEAHAIAARDALAAGQTDAAGEMFAHPVSEVLLEMEPVFAERGVEDFKDLFTNASSAILQGADADTVTANYDAIIAALRAAEEKAPDNGTSAAMVAAGVAADQIERAAFMYGQAKEFDTYGPYLDGYGFYKAGAGAFERNADAIKAENAAAHDAIAAALAALAEAYPDAGVQESLDAEPGALSGASSSVKLALGT